MNTDRTHLLPFGGADMRRIMRASRVPAAPVDPALVAALEWRKTRDARIAAATAARPQPVGALLGSRYAGGSVGTSAAR